MTRIRRKNIGKSSYFSGWLERKRKLIFREMVIKPVSNVQPEVYLNAIRGLNYEICIIDRKKNNRLIPVNNADVIRHFDSSGTDHIDLLACGNLKYKHHIPELA